MKLTYTLIIAAILIIFTSCQSSGGKEETGEATAETESSGSSSEKPDVVLNANLATEEELTQTGLNAQVVAAIVEKRPFLTMNDFDALFSEMNTEDEDKEVLYGKVFVPFNLNTTPEADFKMIPGVGDRMAHEFEEYRPYLKLEQFRREIGKYVDEEEVARYEQYVFVPVELNTATEDDILALPGVGKRMAHEFEEYRPYTSMEQFRKEIGKYVDDKELSRLERFVYLKEEN